MGQSTTISGAVIMVAVMLAPAAHAQYPRGAAAVYSSPAPQMPVYQAPSYQPPVWSPAVTGSPAPYLAPPGTTAGTYYVAPVTGSVNPYAPAR
jgi:hypothetical protein